MPSKNLVGGRETREFTIWPKGVHLAAEFPFVSEQFSLNQPVFTLIVNAGARVGGTSITVAIEEFEPSGNAFLATALLASAAITAAGVTKLTVSPYVAGAANVAVQAVAPKRWRVRVTEQGGITSQDVGISVRYADA